MRILVDVNVVLDVLLDRRPFFAASAAIWSAIEMGVVQGLIAAHAVTTIHYLIRREHGSTEAKQALSMLLRVFGVAMVDEGVIRGAFELRAPDFEDSVTAAAAQLAGCELIVTRDPKGFRGASIRVLAPEAAAPILAR
ncbi:MAG: PIN domain-containing protein [Bryobacteraceae bacterium]|jgi:predicted nucleic acid-binding protein